MKYFIRTEETRDKCQKAMERNRSIRRWAFAGAHPEEHFLFAIPGSERVAAVKKLGFDADDDAAAVKVFNDEIEGELHDELVKALNLEEMETGGYAEFLPGLCALEAFDEEPAPADCSEDFHGELFPYLVCYEGQYVGDDPDEEGWPLFRAKKIVWIHETGQEGRREREI